MKVLNKKGKMLGVTTTPHPPSPEALEEEGLVLFKVLHSFLNKIWNEEDS